MLNSRLRGIEVLEQKALLTAVIESPTEELGGVGALNDDQTSFAPAAEICTGGGPPDGQTSLQGPINDGMGQTSLQGPAGTGGDIQTSLSPGEGGGMGQTSLSPEPGGDEQTSIIPHPVGDEQTSIAPGPFGDLDQTSIITGGGTPDNQTSLCPWPTGDEQTSFAAAAEICGGEVFGDEQTSIAGGDCDGDYQVSLRWQEIP